MSSKHADPSFLFTLRFRLSGGMATITAWEDATIHYGATHTRIDTRLMFNGKEIFARGQTWCGIPGHSSLDGVSARECVTSLFCLRPGDTDSDYFEHYTAEQLEWVAAHAEELDLARECRYCDENGNPKR